MLSLPRLRSATLVMIMLAFNPAKQECIQYVLLDRPAQHAGVAMLLINATKVHTFMSALSGSPAQLW